MKNIFLQDELLSKLNISKKQLIEWENSGLIIQTGISDENIPYYSNIEFEKGIHIKKFLELGYELENIQKIIKKVGLPQLTPEKITNKKNNNYLTVGNLADKIGVSPRTIKHWEDKGIIEPDMRSDGGFRLYSSGYIYLCNLIQDLQLFGYTLEEIKIVSDYFRDFWLIQNKIETFKKDETDNKLDQMLKAIENLFLKMNLLKEGITRWEELLKKKKKEILSLKNKNIKRGEM